MRSASSRNASGKLRLVELLVVAGRITRGESIHPPADIRDDFRELARLGPFQFL